MTTITRLLEVDAGHRLLGHEGRCRNVHGHRYAFEVTVAGPLDDLSRVIDFSVVKDVLGGWLDKWWDHAYIAQRGDRAATAAQGEGLKVYWLDRPPTAETLAAHLGDIAMRLLPVTLRVMRVRCYETPNCWADWTAPERVEREERFCG